MCVKRMLSVSLHPTAVAAARAGARVRPPARTLHWDGQRASQGPSRTGLWRRASSPVQSAEPSSPHYAHSDSGPRARQASPCAFHMQYSISLRRRSCEVGARKPIWRRGNWDAGGGFSEFLGNGRTGVPASTAVRGAGFRGSSALQVPPASARAQTPARPRPSPPGPAPSPPGPAPSPPALQSEAGGRPLTEPGPVTLFKLVPLLRAKFPIHPS